MYQGQSWPPQQGEVHKGTQDAVDDANIYYTGLDPSLEGRIQAPHTLGSGDKTCGAPDGQEANVFRAINDIAETGSVEVLHCK